LKLQISPPEHRQFYRSIQITGSKSETNRLLLLQSLYPNLTLKNLSKSDDAEVMQKGLSVSQGTVDIHHAGTAMRFLTSYFAFQEGKEVLLTGSSRMKERPIGILVEALRSLGAEIEYEENEGYPPLKIKGKKITKSKVGLPANISSQYISSLCLIGPSLANGLEIELMGNITSVPYIKMTLGLLSEIGIHSQFSGNTIKISPRAEVDPKTMVVESDWSAASYYYSVVALCDFGTEIELSAFKEHSLQGDSVLSEIYQNFGVVTEYAESTITLKKSQNANFDRFRCDLSNAPDIAQTIAVTCFGLGKGCHLTGLHTLPIKETDRLAAMKTELEKFGATVAIDTSSLVLQPATGIKDGVTVDTYNDHRMAMAFAPLAMTTSFSINDAEVVSKSYLDFWNDFEAVGFQIKKV